MNTLCVLCIVGYALLGTAAATDIAAFTPGTASGEYRVQTDAVRGLLGPGGLSWGLAPLETVADDTALASMMGLLNYYRVFTTNHRYGESIRALPSETSLEGPHTVRVHWPAAEDRPFTLTGVYHWVAPDTLDLETIVEANSTLENFDVFLASYLSPTFPVSTAYVGENEKTPEFITAETSSGTWQVFPRDEAALDLINDGRWAIAPSPVDWAVRPAFAAPLLFRRAEDSQLAVAMMARSEDCFALFTSCRDESHFSMYVSLFGYTIEAGDTARARIRLFIGPVDNEALLDTYEQFLNSAP